jgi:DNA-binding response OmpR family regulator
MKRILVIEDNRDIANLVAMHLRDMGAVVDLVHTGNEGLKQALDNPYDLVILDLMLPGKDGLEICRELRARPNYTPILMLTAKTTETDRVLGLEMGADDYLTKPFSVRELVARAKAIFRRVESVAQTQRGQAEIVQTGPLSIEQQTRRVTLDGAEVELTAREFDLLLHFAQHPGQVFTRSQLLDNVWGYGHDGYEHTVNSHINRLRAKIEKNPSQPDFILTVWGVGYKFTDARK